MADYDLTRLGSGEFENLAQALAVKHLGPSVQVFGEGRDGGRETTANGPVVLPGGGPAWSGYSVMQAKFRARPGVAGENAVWLRNEVRKELEAWTRTDRPRSPKPDNLLFVSNVVLSAVPGHGVDAVLDVVEGFRDRLPDVNVAVWSFDDLCRLLDDAADLRAAYAGLITPGDVLVELRRMLTGEAADLGGVMRTHAAKELLAEQWVRLGQAGEKSNQKLPLGSVAVDLDAEVEAYGETLRVAVVGHVLEVGDEILRPRRGPSPVHMVVVGGPGQGKTTLAQLMCQAYRVALLDGADDLGPAVAGTTESLRESLAAAGVRVPAVRRWPIRVPLTGYADVLAGSPETSLLRYVAGRVSDRAADTVTAGQLRAWLKAWPWLLVLDGFDEVAAPQVREDLVERVEEFLVDAATVDADLLVVATTRPRGYAGEFTPDRYEHLTLANLDRDAALAYGNRLARVRHADDADMRAHVEKRIAEAADDDLTSRLMRTPLQVTIMSLLLEGRTRVPRHRHGLFDAYYDTIYTRETGKDTVTGRLLDEHRQTVTALHARVGLVLQARAETTGRADASLPRDDLRAMAVDRLATLGFDPAEAGALADSIVKAATDRLVLLVPSGDADVGFEVRSLQEFMAATALVSGDEALILERLRLLAASSHWRNTWLLAAGRVAATREHLVDRVVAIADQLDARDDLTARLGLGADLAADLLDDGFGTLAPKIERLLLKQAVELLRRPFSAGTIASAEILQRVSLEGTAGAAGVIGEVARQAFAGDPPPRITAAVALRRWANKTGSLAVLGQQRVPTLSQALGPEHHTAVTEHFIGFTTVDPKLTPVPTGSLADYVPGLAGTAAADDADALGLLGADLAAVGVAHVGSGSDGHGVGVVRHLVTPDQDVLELALGRPVVAEAVGHALLRLRPDDWAVASALTTIARQWLQHRPVGEDVLGSTPFP